MMHIARSRSRVRSIGLALTVPGLVACSPAGEEARETPEPSAARTERAAAAAPGSVQGGLNLLKGERSEPAYEEAAVQIREPSSGTRFPGGGARISLRVEGFELGVPTPADPPHGVAVSERGQHVHLVVDERPYQALYSVDEPVTLPELGPGFHLVRAFPSRQWHESVKSSGAYASTWFFVSDTSGAPEFDSAAPLLTYSRPKGTYEGAAADTILLDFYLTGATLGEEHTVRVTVDDSLSWDLSEWVPYYLVGLPEGSHRVRLELLGPDLEPVAGEFNATERLIEVRP